MRSWSLRQNFERDLIIIKLFLVEISFDSSDFLSCKINKRESKKGIMKKRAQESQNIEN